MFCYLSLCSKDTLLQSVTEACGQFQVQKLDLYSKDDVGKQLTECKPIQTYEINPGHQWFDHDWTDPHIFNWMRAFPQQKYCKPRRLCSCVHFVVLDVSVTNTHLFIWHDSVRKCMPAVKI